MSDIDALVADYAQEEGEFTYPLPKGQVIRAKRIPDAAAKLRIIKHAAVMEKACRMGGIPDAAPFLPTAPEIIKSAVFIETLVIEPKISFVDALRIAKTCGDLIFDIANPLMGQAEEDAVEGEVSALEDAKNASGLTDSTEANLPSAATSTDDTPSS